MLRAEWEEQRAVLVGFPHKKSDWKPLLKEAQKCMIEFIKQIAEFESVWVCVDPRDKDAKKTLLKACKKEVKNGALRIFDVRSNDIWARDFAPLTIRKNRQNLLMNFGFNGWGLKFAAHYDNAINSSLYAMGVFENLHTQALILEGGSIDSNGAGIALTTTTCLLEKNRNPHLNKQEIESTLLHTLGLKKILWVESGFLRGDDTDSHIDMLARFVDERTIAYLKCEDRDDEHYEALREMECELRGFSDLEGKAFRLIPLPFPKPIYYKKERLPASYANFLFVNGGLIVPIYGDKKNDKKALKTLQEALPNRRVVGVEATTLIKWHGSLHCASMQVY